MKVMFKAVGLDERSVVVVVGVVVVELDGMVIDVEVVDVDGIVVVVEEVVDVVVVDVVVVGGAFATANLNWTGK
jgi:hypothetical protein